MVLEVEDQIRDMINPKDESESLDVYSKTIFMILSIEKIVLLISTESNPF